MSEMSPSHHKFNVVLIGDAGVGKSCFIRKHQTGDFFKDYDPSTKVQAYTLPWNTTAGYIDMTVWEIPGSSELSSASRAALRKADAALIMFDVCNKTTLDHVPSWAREVRAATHDSLPIVVCGNKADKLDGGCFSKPDTIPHEYYDISALDNLNFDEPWFYLFRQLLNDPSLQHVPVAYCPPARPFSAVDEARAIQGQMEMERAAKEPLPDEDDVDT